MNDLYWIGPALMSGLLAARFGLPPLVGYLVTGFVLNVLGFVDYDRLVMIGNLGVTLLLFTIGLKLDVRSLLHPVIERFSEELPIAETPFHVIVNHAKLILGLEARNCFTRSSTGSAPGWYQPQAR